MSEQKFTHFYSCSPLLTLLPELRKTSSGLPLILHCGDLYNYFIIYLNVIIIIEIKCTLKVMCLNHPETTPLPQRPSKEKLSSMKLVPGAKKKKVGTTALDPYPAFRR